MRTDAEPLADDFRAFYERHMSVVRRRVSRGLAALRRAL
jgi:hypothetical protein